IEIVIDELDAEQGEELTAMQPDDEAAPVSTQESDALMDRINGIEQAFSAAVGESRARQLLGKHEASAQQKAMLAMNMRLARLESLLADQAALRALHQPQQAPVSEPTAMTDPAPAPQAQEQLPAQDRDQEQEQEQAQTQGGEHEQASERPQQDADVAA